MSRILTGAINLLLGPLAVGVAIIVLYLWLIKPLLFIALAVVIAFLILQC